jgi:uncharacterized protein (DUF433 family)
MVLRLEQVRTWGGASALPPTFRSARTTYQMPTHESKASLWGRLVTCGGLTIRLCNHSPILLLIANRLPSAIPMARPAANQDCLRDPETMHGIPAFRGTQAPVQTLFDYLEGGDTLEDFLNGFATVPCALALDALEEAKSLLLARC